MREGQHGGKMEGGGVGTRNAMSGTLLHENLIKAFSFWAPRRLGWLPASVICGRAAGPTTASVNH